MVNQTHINQVHVRNDSAINEKIKTPAVPWMSFSLLLLLLFRGYSAHQGLFNFRKREKNKNKTCSALPILNF